MLGVVADSGPPGAARAIRRRRRERGVGVVDVVVAIAVGTVGILGLISVMALAIKLDGQTRARTAARRAAEGRLATLAALDRDEFRTVLTGASAASFLAFDVPRLVAPAGRATVGTATLTPDPVADRAAFDAATSYTVSVEARWVTGRGQGMEELEDRIAYTVTCVPPAPTLESP